MKNFPRSSFAAVLLTLLSCTTSSYKVIHEDDGRVGVVATADRVIFTCEDVQDPDEKEPEEDGRYGFMVVVLNSKNTSTTFVQFSIVTKKNCLDRMATLEKMKLRGVKKFYIAGYNGGYHRKPNEPLISYNFPKHGSIKDSGYTVGFSVLKSDDNECITKVFGEGKPCPKIEGFPEAEQAF